jgi:hypothetical protein
MQLGGVDLSIGDLRVDPLAMFVHFRASPPSPPFGVFHASKVMTHCPPRNREISGDLSDRRPLTMEFMDLLGPLDPTSFGKSRLLSR